MIKYTPEEMLTYQKVKTAFHQQDLIDYLTDLKKGKELIQQLQNHNIFLSEIQDLEKLIDKIKELNTPEEFSPYENYVEPAYWDAEVLQNACEMLLDAFMSGKIQ